MAQNPTVTMLRRPKINKPSASATRQDNKSESPIPSRGIHRPKPAKKMMPTSTTDPITVAIMSWRMLNEISAT
jgi:hypothetical protein